VKNRCGQKGGEKKKGRVIFPIAKIKGGTRIRILNRGKRETGVNNHKKNKGQDVIEIPNIRNI